MQDEGEGGFDDEIMDEENGDKNDFEQLIK